MSELIDDVLYLSRVTSAELREQEVDLSGLATNVLTRLPADAATEASCAERPGTARSERPIASSAQSREFTYDIGRQPRKEGRAAPDPDWVLGWRKESGFRVDRRRCD